MMEGRVATSEQASRAGVCAVALLNPEIIVLGGG